MKNNDDETSEKISAFDARKKTIESLKDTKFPIMIDRNNPKKRPVQKKLNRSSNSTSTSLLENLPESKAILEEENEHERKKTFKHPNFIRDQLEFVPNQKLSKLLIVKKELEDVSLSKTKSVGNLLPQVEEQKNEEEKKSIYHQRLNILKDFGEFNKDDKKDLPKIRASIPILTTSEKDINTIEEVAEGLEKLTLNHPSMIGSLSKSPLVNLKVDEIDEKDKGFKKYLVDLNEEDEDNKVEVIEEEHEGNNENVALERALSKLENDHETIQKYISKDTKVEGLDKKENYLELQGEIIEEQDEEK